MRIDITAHCVLLVRCVFETAGRCAADQGSLSGVSCFPSSPHFLGDSREANASRESISVNLTLLQ